MSERTFATLEPKGEMAVAPRPEGLKLILYTGSGATKKSTSASPWTARPPSSSPWKSCNTSIVWARRENKLPGQGSVTGAGAPHQVSAAGPLTPEAHRSHSTSRTRSMNSWDSPKVFMACW